MLTPISAFLLFSLAISHAIPLEQSKSDLGRISLKFDKANAHPLRPMNDYSSMYMIGQVGGVGTPRRGEKPQKMAKVIFTLSSGDFWVQDSQARKALHCPYDNPVDAFSPRNSTSYAPTVKEFKTHSFKGEVTGKVGKDIVKIGDGLIARNAIFGQASNFSCFFVEQTVSGVMGLGWPQIANKNLTQSPVYAALKKTRNPMFSFHINSETEEGSITFGAFNTLECQQNKWQFTSVSKPGFWQFATTGFAIGPHVHMQAQQAILLESVPFILGQIDDINRFTIELGPSAGYSELTRSVVVGCKEFKEGKLPTVTFHLGNGLDVSLAPEDYVIEDAALEDICPTYFAYKSDFYKTNVLPGDLSSVNWILGRPLMTKYCTSFDFGQKKIGFVLAKKAAKLNNILTRINLVEYSIQ